MPEETPMYRVTFEDCFAVSANIEQEYRIIVVWRTNAVEVQQKWRFSVELIATTWSPDGSTMSKVASAYRLYPTRQHGSLPGAVLDGLYDLEQRLAAQRALKSLPTS